MVMIDGNELLELVRQLREEFITIGNEAGSYVTVAAEEITSKIERLARGEQTERPAQLRVAITPMNCGKCGHRYHTAACLAYDCDCPFRG
jgi:hypothetical protein